MSSLPHIAIFIMSPQVSAYGYRRTDAHLHTLSLTADTSFPCNLLTHHLNFDGKDSSPTKQL